MKNIIETKNLTKKFGRFTAVDNIDLSVGKGEIYGFLGLNGAGKTTTIRMLLGMIRPTAGASFLCGKKVDAGNSGIWKSVGYLVEIPYSYPDLTVRENLRLVQKLRLIRDDGVVESAMDRLGIGRYRDRKAKNLSLGNAQRLGLAKALLHNPEILILDEPANGLDPAGIVEIREMLFDFARNRGVTIFISSHILGEISKFASRIGIIHEGRLLQELNAADLERARKKRLLVSVRDAGEVRAVLEAKGYASTITAEGNLEISDALALDAPEKINALLVTEGHVPSMIKIDEEDLESYFLRAIGKNRGEP